MNSNQFFRISIAAISILFIFLLWMQYNKNKTYDVSCTATTCAPLLDAAKEECDKKFQQISSPTSPAKSKKIISFGLYGNNPKYTFGAIRNTELAKIIFPDWTCRFYVDKTVPTNIIDTLVSNGAEIIYMDKEGINGGIAGMFWRFLVADDKEVDAFIVRDVDSRLNYREKLAIDEFMASDAVVHVLRDHPNHNYKFNGGMWGGKKNCLPFSIAEKMKQWQNKDGYIQDMNFLASVIWPAVQDKQMGHDSFFCEHYPNSRSFPSRRFGLEHVGQVFDENDIARAGDLSFFANRQSPAACRRQPDYVLG